MKTFLAILGFFALVGVSCAVGIGIGGAGSNLSGVPHVSGARVRVVRIEGPITDPRRIVERLESAMADSDVKAVVLRIETPGGAVGASQEVYHAVRQLDTIKPVVASVVNLGASGGYYAALGARTIWANPGSLVGSIGVITQSVDAHVLLEKIGIAQQTVKSGEFKDVGSPFRPMTDREKALFQAMIDDVHAQFREVVALRRKLPLTALDTLADGRIFSGRQAQAVGLIDSVGSFAQAVAQAKSLAKLAPDADLETDDPRPPLLRRLIDPEGEAFSRLLPFAAAPVQFLLP
jgi:protease-4